MRGAFESQGGPAEVLGQYEPAVGDSVRDGDGSGQTEEEASGCRDSY